MAIKPYLVQRRMMELGRIRLGEKGSKGEPRKLTTLRFTSASEALLQAIAVKHGGTVRPWVGAPDEGYFEVTTESNQVDVILPPVFSDTDGAPTAPYSQFFELWSGGGCQRRCDGETELLSGKPCACAAKVEAQGEDARECKVTTRVQLMIPDVPGIGVWRLESHGYNAAVELPGTLEVLLLAAAEHKFIPAVLRIEQRTKKVPGEGTRRFIVPVIELPGVTVRQLASGDVPLAINAPAAPVAGKPALPAAGPLPDDPSFDGEQSPGFGDRPALPGGTEPATIETVQAQQEKLTRPQIRKLNTLVGKLRDAGTIKTEHLWAVLAKSRGVEWEPMIELLDGVDADGVLHWSPLRDSLSKDEATALIDRLEKLEAPENGEGPFTSQAREAGVVG